MTTAFSPIGLLRSCFAEKFGIPRQGGLVPEARATLELMAPYDQDEAVRGLAEFSHAWVIFGFHGCPPNQWSPTVRPPRLGGNTRWGVFASRSPFRPNGLGLSVARIVAVERREGTLCVEFAGLDVMDGTPVYDLKPYLPYADAIPEATSPFPAPRLLAGQIRWSTEALEGRRALEALHPEFVAVVEGLLRCDPRPAYARDGDPARRYGVKVYGADVGWTMQGDDVYVESVRIDP